MSEKKLFNNRLKYAVIHGNWLQQPGIYLKVDRLKSVKLIKVISVESRDIKKPITPPTFA